MRWFLLISLLSITLSSQAWADETDKQKAEALNDKGKARIKQLDLEGAAELFRQAIALSDDPRYSFNLCYTLEKSGKLMGARAACDAVAGAGNERLEKKAAALSKKIDEKLGPRPTKPSEPAKPIKPPGPNTRPPPPIAPKIVPIEEERAMMYGAVFGMSAAWLAGELESELGYGIAFGSWLVIPTSKALQVILEAQYVQRKAAYASTGLGTLTIKSTYLDFSGGMRYSLARARKIYLEGSAVASILIAREGVLDGDRVSPKISPTDFGLGFGLGSFIKTPAGGMDLRVRYILGLVPTVEEGNGVTDGPTIRNRTVLMQVGYWY